VVGSGGMPIEASHTEMVVIRWNPVQRFFDGSSQERSVTAHKLGAFMKIQMRKVLWRDRLQFKTGTSGMDQQPAVRLVLQGNRLIGQFTDHIQQLSRGNRCHPGDFELGLDFRANAYFQIGG